MSKSIDWGDTLLTHVNDIDEEHKELINILNKLHKAFHSKESAGVEKESLVALIDYADYHFSTEVNLMKKYEYPEMANHMELHKEFTGKLKELCNKHLVEQVEVIHEIILFLTSWLFNHIMEVDKKMAIFLREKGVE